MKYNYKIIPISAITPDEKVFGEHGVYLISETESESATKNTKGKWQEMGTMPVAPSLIQTGNNQYKCVSHYEVVLAAKQLKIKAVTASIVSVPKTDVIAWAILSYDHLIENYARMGREVHHLMEFATRNWKLIKKKNPEMKRVKDWTAIKLGFKSDDSVNKLITVLDYDPLLLKQIDDGKLSSLEEAYRKAAQKQLQPKESKLNKENILSKCNCPKLHDDKGKLCPIISKYLNGKEGGLSEAA